jgi:hypothetical protein
LTPIFLAWFTTDGCLAIFSGTVSMAASAMTSVIFVVPAIANGPYILRTASLVYQAGHTNKSN